MKIWVVMGETGEYSDRTDWPVKAFADESKAINLVVDATRRAKELQAAHKGKYYTIPKGSNEFDPNMSTDYTGTSYFINDVELEP